MIGSLSLFEEPRSAERAEVVPGYLHRRRILKLRSFDKRREAIAEIADPGQRALVKFYIADHFARLHHRPLPCLACIEAEEGITRRFPCKHSPP